MKLKECISCIEIFFKSGIDKDTNTVKELVMKTIEDEGIKNLIEKYPEIIKLIKSHNINEDILLRIDSRKKISEIIGLLPPDKIEEILYDKDIDSEIRFIILKKFFKLTLHENIGDIFEKINGDNIEKGILNETPYRRVKYIYDKKIGVCIMIFGEFFEIFKKVKDAPIKNSEGNYEINGKIFNNNGTEIKKLEF